jgi:ribosomal 30S subunit maturation factor RimM
MFLKLGIVGRALGLQGSFYVSGRDEAIPDSVKTIRIGVQADIGHEAAVTQRGWQNQRPFLKCSLAADRTAAERLIGQAIWVEESQVQVDDGREFLLRDLIGRTVMDVDGIMVGTIEDVVRMPASVNLTVVNAAQTADVDIPMIADYVDMSFVRGGSELKLAVPASAFEEIWNPRGLKPKSKKKS